MKGRNFTPDAGCYVYAGDSAIMKLRDWYRQSRVHTTLTLNNENMVITKAALQQWKTTKDQDVLTYINQATTSSIINEPYYLWIRNILSLLTVLLVRQRALLEFTFS
ncbi:heparinase II/III domain-containing protein [Niabella hibiscisoli]|uniref:heparinase II/III domain-containing protein n=1 Tax=Niabella hibiscisoli TaxID=1825928 RepID=UPI00293ED2C8|nr:heparinase II/III family protein [Niabella hibiscisoli]